MVEHPELISFVLRAKNRRAIMEALEKEDAYPSKLMKLTGMYKSHTTRTLKELESKKLVYCKNAEDRAYRFYALTTLGKKIWAEAKSHL